MKSSRLRKKNRRVIISRAREFVPKWNKEAKEETTPVPMTRVNHAGVKLLRYITATASLEKGRLTECIPSSSYGVGMA
jgi:hypothetical protein